MPNRLAGETSPYLLQHANNPVDWHAWGSEALERAKSENKPILLSIGYAACHWCHVMEHESFEDEATARIMNEHFVNIKVDREERPDLDAIYMSAVQAMTGKGGWPMTVFLTPHGVPFYGGTYFPPEERHGMPSFKRVLQAMSDTYSKRPEEISRATAQMRDLYGRATLGAQGTGALDARTLERGYRTIAQRHDMRNGGFEGAPKFPHAMALDYLLRYWRRTGTADALEMAVHSFRKMARGGIYDQVGGGFHRYSVDVVWLVPHFEKMLYDNALLARLGIHLYQATRDAEIRRVTEETVDWVAREMTSPEGGFYSSLDADSEGHEGKFYVWTAAELESLLGADSDLVKAYYGVTPTGNFEGKSILFIPFDPLLVSARTSVSEAMIGDTIERAKRTLYAERAKRMWPARDDKILAGWNGLMLCAVAEVARITGRTDHRALAVRNGQFLARALVRDGRVLRSYKDGLAKLNGYLEDYAAVGLGMLALYELTFERRWLDQARTLADAVIAWFWDESAGSFFDTSSDHETLISRPRELTDNATPSGTALAADLLLRLAELTQDTEKRRRVTSVLEMAAEPMARHGPAFGYLLGVADMAAQGAVEVALVGDPAAEDFRALSRTLAEHYAPALVIAGGMPNDSTGVALLDDRPMLDGRATAYVCRQYACEAPVTDIQAFGEQVERVVRATTVTPYKTPTRSDPDP